MSSAARRSFTPAQQGGRYHVEAELARGGMGVVYRVWDHADRRHKALKRGLSRPGGETDALLEREYRTLISLKHPCIIEAHDFGMDAEGPYYTMELLDGADLRARCPLPWRDACAYLRDVASSLALLHARSLIHRDVSPLNIRLTGNGRAKLLDFGALASFGRQAQAIGTPACMAPEVLDGGELDQRVDLFALGATAYFALTGRMPYEAGSTKLLRQVWADGRPEPPSHYTPDVPTALDELVLSLIALDPLARPRVAAEVIDRLTAIAELSQDDDARVMESYFRHPVLVGRTEVQSRLAAALKRVSSGRPTSVLIEGSAGIGKTAQLSEFEREARFLGILVLSTNARAHKAPLATCKALLERAALELGQTTAQVAPSAEQLSGDNLDPVARMFQRFLELARTRRLLLSVDDAEHADPDSAAVFAQLSKEAGTRLLLAFSASSEDAEAQVGLRPIRRHAVRLQLTPLSAGDVEQLVRFIFGQVPGLRRLSGWLKAEADGSPMVIMELLRELLQEKSIRYVDGAWVLPHELRHSGRASQEAALERRLARLGDHACKLAAILSVHTRPVSRDVVCAMAERALSLSETDTEAALGELVHERVLVGDGDTFAFCHAHLRSVLYGQLELDQRSSLHTWVARRTADKAGKNQLLVLEAALHFALAGDAESAKALGRASDIARHLDQLLQALPTLLALDELHEKLGLDAHGQLRFTYPLLIAGPYSDPALHDRLAERVMEPLEKCSGMYLASKLFPLLGSKLSMLTGISSAHLRYRLTPPKQRWPRFLYPLAYFGACASLNFQASMRLDVNRNKAVLKRLEPVKHLPPTLAARFVYEGVVTTGMYLHGRIAELRERPRTILRDLASVRDMDEGSRKQYENALHFWSARADLAASGESVLVHIEALKQSAVSTDWIMAECLRFAYHLSRGEVLLAERAREALDVLTARHRQNWMADMMLALEFPSYQLAGDVVGLKRCVQQLEPLVQQHPSLDIALSIARAMHEGHRGRPARALTIYEQIADRIAPFTGPFWSHAQAHWAECLNGLERHEDALAKTTAALEQVTEACDHFPTTYQQLKRERALALSGLGRYKEAAAILDGLLAERAVPAHPLLTGLLHRDRARVALAASDAGAFAVHSSQANACFAGTQNPALRAQVAKLLEQALSKQLAPQDGGFARRQLAEALELKAVLASSRSGDLGTEQRLLDHICVLTGASKARLYRVQAHTPVLKAQHGADSWPASLYDDVVELVNHYGENDGLTTVLTDIGSSSSSPAVAYTTHPLLVLDDDRRELVAVLVLSDAPRAGELTLTRMDLFAQALARNTETRALTTG